MTKKIKQKVYDIEGVIIYFNTLTEKFETSGGREFESFGRAKEYILKEKESRFEGEYLIKDSFDGICGFKAFKKIYDDYNNVYKVIGDRINKYGNSKREEYKEDDLYPVNEKNLKILEKSKEMDSEGWKLIHNAKNLKLFK